MATGCLGKQQRPVVTITTPPTGLQGIKKPKMSNKYSENHVYVEHIPCIGGSHFQEQKKIGGKKLFNAALCGPERRELSSDTVSERFPLLFLVLGCMHRGCPAGPVLPKW